MTDLLLIADHPRLHAVVTALVTDHAPYRLTIATSIEQGLAEAERLHPALLLVQDRVSGLASEITLRHLKQVPAAAGSALVLLTDTPDSAAAAEHADLVLDLRLNDNELAAQLDHFVHQTVRPESPILAPDTDQAAVTPPAAGPSATSTPAVLSRFEAELETELARHEAIHPPFSRGDNIAITEPVAQRRRWPLLVGTILFLAGCVVAFLFVLPGKNRPTPSPRPAPAALPATGPASIVQPARTTVRPPEQRLPSFVSREGLDAAYGAAHPGWERYVNKDREFRIYRETGIIKAVQVIDQSGRGLQGAFFSTAIRELAGVRDYRLTTKEVRDGFVVKHGTLADLGRVIIYKDSTDRVLNGFVVHLERPPRGVNP